MSFGARSEVVSQFCLYVRGGFHVRANSVFLVCAGRQRIEHAVPEIMNVIKVSIAAIFDVFGTLDGAHMQRITDWDLNFGSPVRVGHNDVICLNLWWLLRGWSLGWESKGKVEWEQFP